MPKKEWEWQGGVVVHPLGDCLWNRGHFSMRKWESENHQSWGMPVEGFKGHVATAGNWGACGWAVVQLVAWDVWLDGGRVRGAAHHQEGGVNSLLVPSQKMDYGKERNSVLSQEQEMQTCG